MPELVRQLLSLGVCPGGVLLIHTAFSRVRPVEEGPLGLIGALRDALGPGGTLVMPAMADDDDHAFDPATSPCRSMGVVADTFWRLPGVLRTDSPHAFAAAGPRAAEITRTQPLDVPHGPDSPVGRVHDLDGQVLLLGVGHDANTTMHLAENLARVRYRRRAAATVLLAGRVTRREYAEVDHCCENFSLMDGWLDREGLQRRGTVGRGAARLARSRDLVRVAIARLQADETVFLHPPGVCGECDEARAGIP
ncbi:MAG TPA: AAC(3) family N-acetyltransferase [Gemmatimonadales bacterium]